MTTKQHLITFMTQRGMSPEQAEKVFQQALPEIQRNPGDYRVTFERPASEYPRPVLNILCMIIKREALKWIEANIPLAWFKPMFE